MAVWDRDEKKLKNNWVIEIYEKVSNDRQPFINTIHRVVEKIRKRGGLPADNIKFFMVKKPKFAQFYLLPKIRKRLENVLGRPVISNFGFYTENVSAFLDFHLQPLTREVKSYIKDGFFKKVRSLTDLPSDIILCSVDFVGLYRNSPHNEGLPALQKKIRIKER